MTGWRDELLPVVASYAAAPAFRVERAAYPLLGAKGYGVHVNGYTLQGDELRVWVATRAATKATYPGMLDHVAAGLKDPAPGGLEHHRLRAADADQAQGVVDGGGEGMGVSCGHNAFWEAFRLRLVVEGVFSRSGR